MVYRWATEYAKALQQAQQRVKGLPMDTPAPETPPASLTTHKNATTDPSKMNK